MWRKKTHYIWQKVLNDAIREINETPELISMKKYRLEEEEYYNDVYNLFSELCTRIMQDKCNSLRDDVNFYIEQEDIISASVPIKKFRIGLDKMFFFNDYKVIKEDDKTKMTNELAKIVYDYINALKRNFENSDAADCIFECASCLQIVKKYEQL